MNTTCHSKDLITILTNKVTLYICPQKLTTNEEYFVTVSKLIKYFGGLNIQCKYSTSEY